jgi:hypothetical protein
VATVGLLAALLAGGLSGCTSPRNTLGTNSSPCFKALAVASGAVEHRGKLVGIRLLRRDQLPKRHRLQALLSSRAPDQKQLCVAAFEGRYRLGQVRRVYGTAPDSGIGKVAIVVVSFPQNKLVGTLLLLRVPLPVRHEVLRAPPKDRRPPAAT